MRVQRRFSKHSNLRNKSKSLRKKKQGKFKEQN